MTKYIKLDENQTDAWYSDDTGAVRSLIRKESYSAARASACTALEISDSDGIVVEWMEVR